MKQSLNSVANDVQENELRHYIQTFEKLKDSIGKPDSVQLRNFFLFYDSEDESNLSSLFTFGLVEEKFNIAIPNEEIGEIEVSSLQRANRKPTENLTSYEYLLKGKVMHHKIKKEALLESIEMFDKAIEADPNNAQAYAWRACSLGQGMGQGYLEGNLEDILAEAKLMIQKALEIDENDFECNRLLCEINKFFEDFEQAFVSSNLILFSVPPLGSDLHFFLITSLFRPTVRLFSIRLTV